MSGMFSSIIFYPLSVLIVVFAILTIKFRNIFYSLLSAVIVFLLTGVLFYILGSEYNAIIQVAIYGVAVPVILGLAVMFTDYKKNTEQVRTGSALKYLIYLAGGIFILALIYLIMTSLLISPVGFNEVEFSYNTFVKVMDAFGKGLFVKYVWAFELISIILTISVVGLTIFKNERAGN